MNFKEEITQLQPIFFDLTIWNQLSYDVSVLTNEIDCSIQFQLICKIWTENKVTNLLIKPTDFRKHDANQPHIKLFKQIKCYASIVTDITNEKELAKNIRSHCNEFFASVLVSQLEFRYPFVFSMVARQRFQQQEHSIGPLSYALNGSSGLMPSLISLIEKEPTNTVAYQIVNYKRAKWSYNLNIM
ncbi:Uncharacterized protein RNJ44_00748 [Nakaseomyces bracarensis]|uniref:Uncharacterized protein n=1 Tax=Nakaseomyces bracarensis TaxID=273131 RepID=A0ABR4NS67_9SACH